MCRSCLQNPCSSHFLDQNFHKTNVKKTPPCSALQSDFNQTRLSPLSCTDVQLLSFFCSCLFPSAITLQKNLKLLSIKSYTHPSPAITSPHVLPALVHPWVQLPPPSSLVHPWFASPWLSIFHKSFTCFPLTIFFSCPSFWFPYSFNHRTNSLFTLCLTTISLITWPGVILFPVFFFIDPTQLQLPFAWLLTPLSILSVLPDPFCSSLPFSLSCPANHPWFSSAVHSHVPAVHFLILSMTFPISVNSFYWHSSSLQMPSFPWFHLASTHWFDFSFFLIF